MSRPEPWRLAWAALLLPQASSAVAQSQQGNPQVAGQLGRGEASIVILPVTNNADFGGGTGDAFRNETLFNPATVFKLSETLNLISNTQFAVRHWERVLPEHATGLGDIIQNTWTSPVLSQTGKGVNWGIGTVLQAPAASPGRLGERQWGLGPSAFVAVHADPVTLGLVINHPWAVAGFQRGRPNLDRLYMFPFVNLALPNRTTLSLGGDVARNDGSGQWAAPVTVSVSHPVKLGGTEFALGAGLRAFAGDNPGKANIGLQVSLTYTFSRE